MAIILHVLIALISIAYTGFTLLHPNKSKLNISYGLVGLTLITGTGLVIANPTHMVSACFSGIVYLSFMTLGIVTAHKKLAKTESPGQQ